MFSIIAPLDTNRLEQFRVSKRIYDAMDQVKEFIIPTRSYDKVQDYFEQHGLTKNVKLIPYEHKHGFNPSKAFNIGVRNAQYDNIIITSPEVKPKTDVLKQLSERIGTNVVCRVWDEDEEGKATSSLVHRGFRSENPGMYFLAMFQKKDLEVINGWDEDFMKGYAYEDNDFGERWVRAGLKFKVADDIEAVHQYHPRFETIPSGMQINYQKYQDNTNKGVTRCKNGIIVL